MIKKSILLSALLVFCYSLIIRKGNDSLITNQYQYQTNLIKLNKYLFANTTPKSVILGSSLSARIENDTTIAAYNLALAGMSVSDGLNIINLHSQLPKAIFIEINFLTRPENHQIAEVLNSKITLQLKEYFPILREENQPVGLLKGALLKIKPSTTLPQAHEKINTTLFDKLLADQIAFYSNADTILIDKSVLKLKTIVKTLEAKGTKVYFFEVPVNKALMHLPYASKIRREIKENFPENIFIPYNSEDYTTVDGLHLDIIDAAEYSKYFNNRIKELIL